MKEIILTKEKIGTSMLVSNLLIPEATEIFISQMADDFAKDCSTIAISGFLAMARKEIQETTLYRKPQGFWDWLFRREQKFTFEINCKEFMVEPPIFHPDKSIFCYQIKESEC